MLPYILFEIIKSFLRYRKWNEEHYDSYKTKIDVLVEEGKLKEFVKPTELPTYFWKAIDMDKPKGTIDKAKDVFGLTVIVLFFAVAALGGALWMTPKFW